MSKIITEITPLSEKDCFYLVDRYKDRFTYPVHRHEEYELNFVANCNSARRIVGDSVEILSDYDLVLVGNGIEHGRE
ncbi:MAG: AraC family transcriptional regulator, partial [Duncaniella sp.]|nr:AraC family transcriptional regulator [Duncaniella sp.]